MTDDFNVVRTLGRDRSRELGTVTVHGRDIEISCTLADGFCATVRPQTGTILTFSSRRLGWHGFQSSPLLFGGSTVSIRHDMPSARLARDFDAALSAEAESAMRSASPSRRHLSTSRRSARGFPRAATRSRRRSARPSMPSRRRPQRA
ncbi:MAG: hypothetical protein ACLUYK_00355 [Eggerthella lenta]